MFQVKINIGVNNGARETHVSCSSMSLSLGNDGIRVILMLDAEILNCQL